MYYLLTPITLINLLIIPSQHSLRKLKTVLVNKNNSFPSGSYLCIYITRHIYQVTILVYSHGRARERKRMSYKENAKESEREREKERNTK